MILESRTFIIECDSCHERDVFSGEVPIGATISEIFDAYRDYKHGDTRWRLINGKLSCSIYCEESIEGSL